MLEKRVIPQEALDKILKHTDFFEITSKNIKEIARTITSSFENPLFHIYNRDGYNQWTEGNSPSWFSGAYEFGLFKKSKRIILACQNYESSEIFSLEIPLSQKPKIAFISESFHSPEGFIITQGNYEGNPYIQRTASLLIKKEIKF